MDADYAPALRLSRTPGSVKPLYFEGLVLGAYSLCLLDSGASHSFVSSAFCRSHGIAIRGQPSTGRNADGSDLALPGFFPKASLKLGTFRTKIDLYVADIGDIDMVLGVDFFL